MSSRISQVTLDHGDLSAPEGSSSWARAVHFEAIGALNDAASTRGHLDVWIKALRETGAYRQMQDEQGRPFLLWEVYCTARQPIGLGYSSDEIDAILSERASVEARNAKDAAAQRPGGRPKKTLYDVQGSQAPTGNRTEAMLRRLRKDRPDLHAEVLAGGKTPHAAMIEAGFRKARLAVPLSVDGVVRAARRLPPGERRTLVERLIETLAPFPLCSRSWDAVQELLDEVAG